MQNTNLLLASDLPITETLSLRIPTVGEILDFGEDDYFGMAQAFSSVPYDAQLWLDDMGIDYQEISEFELFFLTLCGYRNKDLSLLFGPADLSHMEFGRKADGNTVLFDSTQQLVIDELLQREIADGIRLIHGWKRTEKTAGNQESKKYMLERLRKQRKRFHNKPKTKYLEDLVVAMVNHHDFKYDYSGVRELNIYCFHRSVNQLLHGRNADALLQAVYNGKIDSSKLDEMALSFIRPASDR